VVELDAQLLPTRQHVVKTATANPSQGSSASTSTATAQGAASGRTIRPNAILTATRTFTSHEL
jgi:hypothetical protein